MASSPTSTPSPFTEPPLGPASRTYAPEHLGSQIFCLVPEFVMPDFCDVEASQVFGSDPSGPPPGSACHRGGPSPRAKLPGTQALAMVDDLPLHTNFAGSERTGGSSSTPH